MSFLQASVFVDPRHRILTDDDYIQEGDQFINRGAPGWQATSCLTWGLTVAKAKQQHWQIVAFRRAVP